MKPSDHVETVVHKPFTISQLEATLRRVVRQRGDDGSSVKHA